VTKTFVLWESEYPEEGSMLVEAATKEEAVAKYTAGWSDEEKACCEVSVEAATPEIIAAHAAQDEADVA
jgi:hypothetical protein